MAVKSIFQSETMRRLMSWESRMAELDAYQGEVRRKMWVLAAPEMVRVMLAYHQEVGEWLEGITAAVVDLKRLDTAKLLQAALYWWKRCGDYFTNAVDGRIPGDVFWGEDAVMELVRFKRSVANLMGALQRIECETGEGVRT